MTPARKRPRRRLRAVAKTRLAELLATRPAVPLLHALAGRRLSSLVAEDADPTPTRRNP